MDKHERIAEQYLINDPVLELSSPEEYRDEVQRIAAILRREYGDERSAALEEAAKVCDKLAEASDRIIEGAGDAARAHAAAIRALKEATVVVSVERLREIEWLESHNGDEPKSCPACLRYQSFGHLPDCWLAAALREETVPHV
jgi:hypothetical protein